jgi:hypothetical protein
LAFMLKGLLSYFSQMGRCATAVPSTSRATSQRVGVEGGPLLLYDGAGSNRVQSRAGGTSFLPDRQTAPKRTLSAAQARRHPPRPAAEAARAESQRLCLVTNGVVTV